MSSTKRDPTINNSPRNHANSTTYPLNPDNTHKPTISQRPISLFDRSAFNAHSLMLLPTFDAENKRVADNRANCSRPQGGVAYEGGQVGNESNAGALARLDVFYRGSLCKEHSRNWSSCPDMSQKTTLPPGEKLAAFDDVEVKGEGLHLTTPTEQACWRRSRFAVFAYFCLSNVLLYAAYDIPYLYTPVYWISVNIGPTLTPNSTIVNPQLQRHLVESQAASLVSYIGFASTFGQVTSLVILMYPIDY